MYHLTNTKDMPALFQIDLNLTKDYSDLFEDLLKFAVMLFTVSVLSAIGGKIKNFGEVFQNILFTIVGLAFYHLVVKKVVKFVFSNDVEEGFTSTWKIFDN